VGTLAPLALSDSTLTSLAERGVEVPTYDRSRLVARIAHIGVGGFHRAHLALYTDDLAAAGASDWGIRGIGLLPGDTAMAAALSAQDHLYTLVERGTGAPTVRVVGSIIEYHHCAGDPHGATALLADPDIAVVSLTITEAGYGDAGAATFDVLAAALARRRAEGSGPVAIVSCDNLPGNGDAARGATLAAAARCNSELGEWISSTCSFPNSMVDRITPVTADADRDWLAQEFGVGDRWPVVAEPFRQWVVEDDFAGGRPPWEDAGVLFSDRVHDWELYKLRLLNAGHSSIAYLCALAGITYVDEAMADPAVHGFLTTLLLAEAVPSLDPIPGHPREEYVATVMERFANTGVRDQIARLCIDGTAKFPTFLVPTIEYQLAAGGPVERSALALAGWAHYLATVEPDAQAHDASAETSRTFARRARSDPVAFLDHDAVFPPALAADERFRSAFTRAHEAITARGPRAAMAS